MLHGQGRWPWSGEVALAYMSDMCGVHFLVLGVWRVVCCAWPIVGYGLGVLQGQQTEGFGVCLILTSDY